MYAMNADALSNNKLIDHDIYHIPTSFYTKYVKQNWIPNIIVQWWMTKRQAISTDAFQAC